MRVTHRLMTQSMNHNLGASLRRLYAEQEKISTGKRIHYPADDPVGLESAMRLGSMVNEYEQYQRNVDDAVAWLSLTESSLAQIGEGLHRVRELTVNAANGTLTDSDRQDIAKEIAQIRDDVFHIGNTRFGDRYIFAGTATQRPPFENDNGALVYKGSTQGDITYEIGPGTNLGIGVRGDRVILPVLDLLGDLHDALDQGDQAAIDAALGDLDTAFGELLRWRSEVGARMSRLELAESRYADDMIHLKGLISEREDVDYAEAILRLKQEENVYRAALASGARVIQPTLIDFLR